MHPSAVSLELVRDVELLCLDAGNTIVFFDHAVAAQIATEGGFPLESAQVERAEGSAKQLLGRGAAALAPALPDADITPGWGAFMRTIVEIAGGLDRAASAECVRLLWRAHREFNLWRRVADGLIDALAELRAAGVPVCVVSNSEGRLRVLFEQLGIVDAFDLVLDSQILGVEKPDPAIFHHALAHFRVAPERALHLGDVVATDIVGARAAGVRAALIDPFGHYEGQHLDVLRVPSAAAVARAVRGTRG